MIKKAKNLRMGDVFYSVEHKQTFVIENVFLGKASAIGSVFICLYSPLVTKGNNWTESKNWIKFSLEGSIPVIGHSINLKDRQCPN